MTGRFAGAKDFLDFLDTVSGRIGFPDFDDFARLAKASAKAQSGLLPGIRPRDRKGRPGGYVRTGEGSPVVIVPDLHVRHSLFGSLFRAKLPEAPGRDTESTIAELFLSGRLSVVCLGDLAHSETDGAKERWLAAFAEFRTGWLEDSAIVDEMTRFFSCAEIVFTLESAFPDRFFFLKGNHDNAMNAEGGGDHPFGKFSYEGEISAEWTRKFAGFDTLDAISRRERVLPLVAFGPGYAASHAEPSRGFTREEILLYRDLPDVVDGLTWTPNDTARDGSVEDTFSALSGTSIKDAYWFTGHRPVTGRYSGRQGGKLLQIHTPDSFQAAYVDPETGFDPDRDIFRF